MIISKAPVRVSFGGGGSDLPAYYRHHGGCVLSTSINKYAFIQIHPNFHGDRLKLKYSQTEDVASVDEVQHRIFSAVLRRFGMNGVEINSMADIPAGTGMGSSSTFTVALLHAIYAYRGIYRSKNDLAAEACDIEINVLGNPIGRQDQYASAFGGLNFITFNTDDSVRVEPLLLGHTAIEALNERLMLFYTGDVRDANAILAEQSERLANEADKTALVTRLVELCKEMKMALENGALNDFGRLLHASWLVKKQVVGAISNRMIDEVYETGLRSGALGGKLLGAGGGGFVLLYSPREKQESVRRALSHLKQLPFRMENSGAQIIYYES